MKKRTKKSWLPKEIAKKCSAKQSGSQYTYSIQDAAQYVEADLNKKVIFNKKG